MQRNWSVKSVLQTLRQSFYIVGYKLARLFIAPRDGLVLFLSDSNAELVNNQKPLADELTVRGYDVRAVLRPSLRTKRSLRDHFRLCQLMARAKVIVVDDFYPMIYQIKLRPGTQLLQIWHASGAFKTMGFSRAGKPGGPITGSKTHKNYTAAIVSSPAVRANYAEAFGIDVSKVHATGIPRTDVFFNHAEVAAAAKDIRNKLAIPEDRKLALFAPTFRGNGQVTAHYPTEWIDWNELATQLGDEYVIGYKPHPFVSSVPAEVSSSDVFRDLSALRDTNRLLMATDLLITDYSSIIFDYALLDRPTVFFCPDLEEYISSRDFYYPYERYAFGPIARTTSELIEGVRKARGDTQELHDFVEFFCGSCDGQSTSRVIDELIAPFAGIPGQHRRRETEREHHTGSHPHAAHGGHA